MKLTELITHGGPLKYGDLRADAVMAAQVALRKSGHELVPDGDFGPITRTAVERFQGAHGLAVDGVIGPKTAAALDLASADHVDPPMPSILKDAPHLARMRAMTGIKEIPGAGDNPLILKMRDDLATRYPQFKGYLTAYTHDSIAWCGLGMAAAVGLGSPSAKPPNGFLWALNWGGDWGVPVSEPFPGVVMTFKRDGGGHVSLYESEDDDHWYIRGANQSDQMCVSARRKSLGEPVSLRWPPGISMPMFTNRKFGRTSNVVVGAREA